MKLFKDRDILSPPILRRTETMVIDVEDDVVTTRNTQGKNVVYHRQTGVTFEKLAKDAEERIVNDVYVRAIKRR